jgi:hypothetical protein
MLECERGREFSVQMLPGLRVNFCCIWNFLWNNYFEGAGKFDEIIFRNIEEETC